MPPFGYNIYKISIHALREEGDLVDGPALNHYWNFYPRPPRGGRPKFKYPKQPDLEISIHALREEGDPQRHRCDQRRPRISIHALREEGD